MISFSDTLSDYKTLITSKTAFMISNQISYPQNWWGHKYAATIDWLIDWLIGLSRIRLRKAKYNNPQPCWHIIREGDSKSFDNGSNI